MEQKPKVVYLDVVGCPENRYDAAQLKALLEKNGITVTDDPAQADTLVVNTCGLTRGNEKLSREIINKVKHHSSNGSRLIICGCLPKINPEALNMFKEALLIPGPMLDTAPWVLDHEWNPDTVFNPSIHPQAYF